MKDTCNDDATMQPSFHRAFILRFKSFYPSLQDGKLTSEGGPDSLCDSRMPGGEGQTDQLGCALKAF